MLRALPNYDEILLQCGETPSPHLQNDRFTLMREQMTRQLHDDVPPKGRKGCGPLIAPWSESLRPLRQQVFEQVRASGLISRVQVAKALGISPASVTAITSELLDGGLIEEVALPRDADLGRGRPAVAMGVRGAAHLVAGMKLSDREHTAVISDFAGNMLAQESIPRDPNPTSLEEILDAITHLLDRVCRNAGIAPQDLAGLGIGVPGFVDYAEGLVLWSSILTDRSVPLAAAVQERLHLPVSVDNDANLVALAELWFGAGRDLPDFAIVTIEHGVGMGFVMNHRIYRGAQRLGLELGHTKVQLDGALCRCGQRGCLEAYIADYALAREAVTALNLNSRQIPSVPALLEQLFQRAREGNPTARSIFRRAGRYLSMGLANVVNLFDPALIILSGERMRYDYLYAEETLAEMKDLVINSGRPCPPIEIHAWGDMLWAQGAAALALSVLTERILTTPREMAAQ